MMGFEPFALATRQHLVPTWAALCGAVPLPVPVILLEDPGDNRPTGHYVIFSLLKASVAPYNGGTSNRLCRTLGRAQGLLHLTAGSGPKPADQYASVWRAVWQAFMQPGTRLLGVRFDYARASQANELGSIGTHAVWALDVPYRYDELPEAE